MSKKLVIVVLFAILAIVFTGCATEAYSEDYVAACYDVGGLMGPDGCVIQSDDSVPPKGDPAPVQPTQASTDREPASGCEERAKAKGIPADVIDIVCEGSLGQVSPQLPSGTRVSFGSITFDCQDTVWVLEDFTVPAIASYAFSYENGTQNLLDAPFMVGSELGYAADCETRVPFKVCYNTTDEGCQLPPEVKLFPTQ